MKIRDVIVEFSAPSVTVAANVDIGVVGRGTHTGNSFIGSPGKSGTQAPKYATKKGKYGNPVAPQEYEPDGTAKNALNMKGKKGGNLLGGQGLVKRKG